MEGLSPGESGLHPAWAAKSLALAEIPPPYPEKQTWTERLQLSKVWAKLRKTGL